jgi:hypothetical protein
VYTAISNEYLTFLKPQQDENPPQINGSMDYTFPENTSDNSIQVNISDENLFVASVYKNNSLQYSVQNLSSLLFNYSLPLLLEGIYLYNIVAMDQNNNSKDFQIIVKIINITKPKITGNTYLEFEQMSGSQVITWNVYDLNPLNYTMINNSIVIQTGNLFSNIVTFNVNTDVNSNYELELIVFDKAGNSENMTTLVMITDHVSPNIFIISPVNLNTNQTKQKIIFFINESDSSWEFVINKTNYGQLSNESIIELIDGQYELRLIVMDKYGNLAEFVSYVNIDTQAPLFDLISPLNDSITNMKQLLVDFNLDDGYVLISVNGTTTNHIHAEKIDLSILFKAIDYFLTDTNKYPDLWLSKVAYTPIETVKTHVLTAIELYHRAQ